MTTHIGQILLDETTIKDRVYTLAQEIGQDYKYDDLSVILLTNGAIVFSADLIRQLPMNIQLDSLSVTSYQDGVSTGKIKINSSLKIDIANRHVLLVDDILDTGLTLKKISTFLETFRPKSLKTCVLLKKSCPKQIDLIPDYCGFEVPNKIIIGYGLDYQEEFRNLPYIATYHQNGIDLFYS